MVSPFILFPILPPSHIHPVRLRDPLVRLPRVHLRDIDRHTDLAGLGPDPDLEPRRLLAEFRSDLFIAPDRGGVDQRDGSVFRVAIRSSGTVSERV